MKFGQGILGETVDRLRTARQAGASASQLLADLRGGGMEIRHAAEHLAAAFCLTGQANIALIPKTAAGEPDPEILDGYIADCIDAARPRWEHAPSYPDLLRRRDRIAFQQVARRHGIVLIVCAANQRVGQDRSGYRVHGAYRFEAGANAWTGSHGESLRAELNRRMNGDFVLGGPHDTWADRLELDDTNPLRGPQPPVLFFLPDGDVEIRTDARGMELYYRFLGIDWDSLYPEGSASEEEAG